ncbi:DUF58 domain-containing protein [Schaalia sp. 19OD2882]|uniref:DUF58 domain-containing protein n=1 Tax=Schaalia sp. 19OD2882 TaxID=2794089 RepID=UPI0020A771A2|nr:DUF58 domain-containing protein [Schaalia sp. 19OD2882]
MRDLAGAASRAVSSLVGSPLLRWIRRSVGWVTPVGWAVIACALACVLVVQVFGWVEAHVMAVVCGLALLIAVLWVFVPSPHAVDVRLPQARIVAGQSVVGEVQVRNVRRGRSASGIVELPVGSSAVSFVVPSLAGEATWDEVFSVVTRRRGVIVIGPPRTVRSDALGLLRRERHWSRPLTLHVHPRTTRLPFDATGALVDVEGVTTARLSSSDVSFHALRDYVPGDARRNVHWPTTARTGRLVVRVFEETRRSHHLILLDTNASQWGGEDFELGVSLAASLGLVGVGASRKVSFATTHGWISTASPVHMLDDLAEVNVSRESVDLVRRLREVQAARPGASVLTVVVGPTTTDDEAAHIGRVCAVDTVCAVLRVKPGSPMSKRRVGEAELVDCPTLNDLQRIVAAGGLS